MNKVICDICGTSYPETAECCPICGCTRDMSAELMADAEDDFLKGSPVAAVNMAEKRNTSSDFEEEPDGEYWDDDGYEEDDDEEEESSGRGRTGVVILLVVIIMLLLSVAGFLFLRYLLPNLGGEEPAQTEPQIQTEAVVETTTEPGIPCDQLILMSGAALDLSREGEYRLINVIVKPEDSTDTLTYTSADETVATVNAEGRVTAVGEGDTVITITCGYQQVECRVFVHYVEETEPPTEETTEPEETEKDREPEAEAQEKQDEPAGEDPTEDVNETEPAQETEPAETQEETTAQLKDVVLKIGRNDISLGVGVQFTMPLDCELEYSEIEWTTGNANVATVKDGVITTHGMGTTLLTAKYGEQTVTCWVRVKF